MSTTVDNRVVSMEFDNSRFEKNVETSLGSLRHLDNTLNEIDGTSFNKLSGSVDYIADKFTLFGTLTRKVFDRIADGIIDVSERMIRGFSIDQMSSGWDKYAEKTTSVQTIMSATGDSIETVTEQLEKLNWFTDETSYSFTDMTSNIAKFTSQGIGLEDAVNEMQGIALWAASAGQNAQSASRAMYNISQAMGAGSMKLIDWKSIQNANMATKEFKEEAIKAAVAVGTLVEAGDHWITTAKGTEVTLQNFDQTLADGWLNSAAMEMVFNKYGMFADVLHELSDVSGLTATELLNMYDCYKEGGDIQEEFAEEIRLSNVSAEELLETFAELNTESYALGEKAFRLGQEAKTLGDALDATADAASTAWMNLFETIFGNYEQQKKIWTDLSVSMYDWFAEPVNQITLVLKKAMGIRHAFEGATEDLSVFGDVAEKVLRSNGYLTDDMVEQYGSVGEAIRYLQLPSYAYEEILDEIKEHVGELSDEQVKMLETYQSGFQELLENYNLLDDKINGISGRELLFDPDFGAFYNLLNIVTEIGSVISRAWNNVFRGDRVSLVFKFLQSLQAGTAKILSFLTDSESETHRLERTLTGVFSLIDIGKQAIVAVFNGVKQILQMLGFVGEGAFEGVASLADWITALDEAIKDNQIFETGVGFIVNIIGSFITVIQKAVGKLKELYTSFKELEQVKKATAWIKETFSTVLAELPNLINNATDTLLLGLSTIFSFFTTTIPNGIRKVIKYIRSIKFDKFFSFITRVKNGLVDLFKMIKQLVVTKDWQQFIESFTKRFPKISEVINNVKDTLSRFFRFMKEQGAPFIKRSLGALMSVITVLLTIKTILSFNKVLDSASGFLEALTDVFSGVQKAPKIIAIVGIALALVILVGEVKMLADLPKADLQRAIVAIGILGGILVLLTGVAVLASKFDWANGIAAVGGGVFKFAAALGILALTLYGISKIPNENFGRSLATLAGMMLGLALVAKMMSKKSLKLVTGGSGLIMYALAINVLAGALKKIQDNAENLSIKAFMTLIGIMGALAVLSFLIKGVRFGGALGILLLALSLVQIEKALMNAIDNAIPFEVFKQYWKELASIITILAGFALLTRLTGKGSVKGVLSLLALIGLLYLLPGIIAKLGEIPSEQLWKGVKTIAIIGLVLAGVMAATSLMAKMTKEGLKTVKWILIGIAGLVIAVYLMRDMTKEQLMPAVIAIGTVMVALGAAILLATIPLSRAKKIDPKAIVGLIIILAGIGAVIAALWWLSTQDLPNLVNVALSLAAVMVALGIALYLIESTSYKAMGIGDSLKTAITAVLMLGAVILALWAIQQFDIQASIKTVAALSILLLALSACLLILSFTKTNVGQALANGAALAIASVSLIAIAFALSLMKDIDLDGVSSKLLILGGVLIELSICLAILQFIPLAALGPALLALVGILAVLGLVMLAFAALGPDNDKMVKVAPKITNGFTLMGEALGAFIGGFIGGIGVGLTATMTQMADNLTRFAEHLQPFLDSIGQITDQQVKGMDSLTALMLKLAAAELLNALSNLVSGLSLFSIFKPSFSEKLIQFAQGMRGYLEAIKGVTSDEVARAVQLTDSFVNLLTALPKDGGIFQLFTGSKNFKGFSKQLVGYGQAIKDFCNELSFISESAPTQMTMASSITDIVVEIAEKIPHMSSALVTAFTGDNNAKKFGQRMSYFISSLVEVCTQATHFSEADLVSLALAKDVAEKTADVSSVLPKVAGLFQALFVEHDSPSVYGEQMANFMGSLVSMAKATAPLTPEDLTQMDLAKSLTVVIVSMSDLIPQVMSLMGQLLFTHDNEALFGTRMKSFIESLTQAALTAKNIPEDSLLSLEHAKQTTIKILEVMASIPSSNIFTKRSFATSGDIIAFGNSANEFASVMAKYVDITSTIDAENASKTTEHLTQIATQLNSLSGHFSVIALDSQKVVTSFSNAVRGIEHCCSSMLSIVMNFSHNFEKAGNYFGYGFAKGIMDQIPNVQRAASNMGVAAANALARAAQIRSPSRVTQKMGGYFGEGWVNGIEGMYHTAAVTAEGLADTTIDAVAYAREAAANLLDSDYDPVIRPIVDLTNVEAAAKEMQNFGNLQSTAGVRKVTEVNTVITNARKAKNDILTGNANNTYSGNFTSSNQANTIINELHRLSQGFDSLSEAIQNMDMVLDSGVLVGELAPQMNTRLGTIATRERRQ